MNHKFITYPTKAQNYHNIHPQIAMDEPEPQDESDSYLESMLSEDLSDAYDMDVDDMS